MASTSSSGRDGCKHTDVETAEVCACSKFVTPESEDKLLCRDCGHHASFHVPRETIKSGPGRCLQKFDAECDDGCQEFFPSSDPKLPESCGGCGCHKYDHLSLSEVEGNLPRSSDEVMESTRESRGDGSNTVDRDHDIDGKHKIFISFSGAQRRFAKKLCDELVKRDRYPFYDRRPSSLPVGENAPDRMWEAIKRCRVGVVILSEEYFTRTKWPMLEFVRMAKRIKEENPIKIIPVFLGISRDDCLDPKKWSKKWEEWASLEKNKRFNIDVDEWEQSVVQICGPLQNLTLRSEGQKGHLRKEIVDAICKEILPETISAPPNVQGQPRLYEIFRKMVFPEEEGEHRDREVRVVGLYGMGGVGKTTFCEVLRCKLSGEFCDKVCHVELGKKLSTVKVFRKVIRELAEVEPEELVILNDEEDVSVFKRYLGGGKLKKRVFLAIDNVTLESEIFSLSSTLKNAKWRNGSVVLITARSLHVLVSIGVDRSQCFGMPDLQKEEARALFLDSVRSIDPNVSVDEELVTQCLNRCYFRKGDVNADEHWHPLALEVLGKQLMSGSHKPTDWKRLLKRIDVFNVTQAPTGKHPIFSILRSSFNALRDDEKLLFMDIALYRRQPDMNPPNVTIDNDGRKSFTVCIISDDDETDDDEAEGRFGRGGGFLGIERAAREVDLISVFDWLCTVHRFDSDKLMEMLESLKRKSLLETANNEYILMHDLWHEFALEETQDGDIIERRWIFENEPRDGPAKGDNVRSMRFGVRELKNRRNLNFSKFPFISVLTVFGLQSNTTLNVDGLDLLCSLEVAIDENDKFEIKGLGTLDSLAFLRIWAIGASACLQEIRCLMNLEVLDLEGFCGDTLPDFSGLKLLRFLNLRQCFNLESVDLRGLPNLTDLDVDFGGFQKFHVSGCKSLRKVWGLSHNKQLQEVELSSCSSLKEFPSIRRPKRLMALNISGCPKIEVWGLERFRKLKDLDVSGCTSLTDLSGLRCFRTLTVLRALGCDNITQWPDWDRFQVLERRNL